MTGYTVQIKREPSAQFQSYRGWDKVYATRREAIAVARDAEKAGHHKARVVRVSEAN
jgi:hypothetical protein